jgi:hypothetical protein
MRNLFLQASRNHHTNNLRLVLDDDKIHCEGKKCNWDNIKKVKHEKCNRFGANMHSLVSSLSNIVYSIAIERDKCNTIDCVQECLLSSFPKRNNNREPDLRKVIIGFDRGYNGFLNLVSYIVKCGGNTFGTSKRALHNIFTYDQKKRDWDKREFRCKEGARILERMSCPLNDTNMNKVGELTSIFYRNGHGGAILMQSTLPEHQSDTWDRVGQNEREATHGNKRSYYKPHPFFSNGRLNSDDIEILQEDMARLLETKILLITADQNVPEWFISRMFCLTASPAQQYVTIGLKDASNKVKDEWIALNYYATNTESPIPTSVLTTNQVEHINATEWAQLLFEEIDGNDWLSNRCNLECLEAESTSSKDAMTRWRAIQREFQKQSQHSMGYTKASPNTISEYILMSEDEKILFDLDTTDKLRKRLRERVPRQSALFKQIKNLNGKFREQFVLSPNT